MELDRAFRKAIKAYFDGVEMTPELDNTVGGRKKNKYTKDYFDGIKKDILNKGSDDYEDAS